MNLDAPTDPEAYVADLQFALTTPLDRECLACYLLRMVREFGCDGTHRWTIGWRELSALRATALLRRLANRGGCCCDCEVLMNVYPERLPEDDSAPLPRFAGISRQGCTAPCTGVQ